MNARQLCSLWLGSILWALAASSGNTAAADVEPAAPAPSNAVEKVEASAISGQTLIKVTLRAPLAQVPSSFTVSAPPRIAFDFPDTENATGETKRATSLSDLQSFNIVQAGARTRMVLNLSKSSRFSTRLDGKTLYITLSSSAGAEAPTMAAAPRPAGAMGLGATATESNAIQSIDFRAESGDVARINIDLAEPNPSVDVKRQGSGLVLTLQNVRLPERLARRLDVRDFGTPVVNVTSTAYGQGTQLVLNNRGDWDYNVVQTDTVVRVEVRRIVTDPNSLVGAKELQGKTVSFNFTQPVPVSQMMGIFQDITGLNFMMMPGVSGEIERLKMENTPVETAINVVSRMYGLSMRRFGDLVVVGKAADLARYEKEERDLQSARQDGEPIEHESIKVRHRPAAEIAAALTGTPAPAGAAASATYGTGSTVPAQGGGNQPAQGGAAAAAGRSILSARGSVTFDAVTNTIFVEETRTQLNKIRDRIAALDLPIKQVMIEARIVSASTTFSRTLGTKLGYITTPYQNTGIDAITGKLMTGVNTTNSSILSSNVPSGATATRLLVSDGPQLITSGGFNAAGGAKAGDFSFALFNSNGTRLINAELYASETDGTTKNIANPKILTQDGRQATITDGQTLFYQLAGGTSGPTTVSVDAATKLDVTPQIGSDGKIQLKINVNKGGVGTVTTNAGPSVTKQEINTNVVVENGGTLMLGGVFTETINDAVNQVPLLGDIPVLGWLFKQKDKVRNRSELLIFLTPRIVTEELTLQ